MEIRMGRARIRIVPGDITEQETDAIVNAANPTLMGGGGVDGAIHKRGGARILEECKRIRETQWRDGLPRGKAVITSGGNLKARYVIHTVGPVWQGGDKVEALLLRDCYRNCLALAVTKELKTIAFPSIGTGAYGYPIEKASRIALRATKQYLVEGNGLKDVVFVLFSESDLNTYQDAAREVFGFQ